MIREHASQIVQCCARQIGKCQLLQEITNNVKAIKSYGANIGNNHTPLIWDDE